MLNNKILLVFLMVLNSALFVKADVNDDIVAAIKTGNSRQLGSFFNTTVELNIPGNEGMFSKAQAEVILKDFFSKNQCVSFSLMHQGTSKDGAKYAIGKLQTTTGLYRVYYFLKKAGESFFIKEFRIETEK